MILLSLANYLRDGFMTGLFHNDPRVASNELLLQEQVPYHAPLQWTPSQEVHDVRPVRPPAAITSWRVPEDPPLPIPAQAPYLVRHGAGYTVFEHRSHGVHQHLQLFAAPHEPVKFLQ